MSRARSDACAQYESEHERNEDQRCISLEFGHLFLKDELRKRTIFRWEVKSSNVCQVQMIGGHDGPKSR